MMHTRLREDVNSLVRKIANAGNDRHVLRPELSAAIATLQHAGFPVPNHLLRLEADLRLEAQEALFDNMPI